MELQEYHVKRLFRQAGLPVLPGGVAYTSNEAMAVARRLRKGPFLVKAQIVGGSGCYGEIIPLGYNGNGCVCVKTISEVGKAADSLLKNHPDWLLSKNPLLEIEKVYVEQGVVSADFVGRLVFRINFEEQCKLLHVESASGQSQDFKLAEGSLKETLLQAGRVLCPRLKIEQEKLVDLMCKAYDLFELYGAVAVELSPIVKAPNGNLKVLDGRLVFDPDSTTKFPELIPLIETRVGKERERMARQNGFRYMGMKGNIACVVNGIGLGWATIDLVQRKGGTVAALLDIGTEPTKEVVTKALRLVLAEPNVDGVLVNIFGGLTRCDVIAEGLISASPEVASGLPIVVRMDGMNAEIGQRLLFESKIPFVVKTKMDEAVRFVVKLTKEKR